MPWQVVVFRGSRVIQLWKDKKLVYTNRVAVGAPGMETPLGLFYVTVRFKPVKEPFLGAFAFETSAYSKLSDWPGGGVVGLHGWADTSVLGRAVSHGCIRVSNATAAFLRDRIPVGTPIRVVATRGGAARAAVGLRGSTLRRRMGRRAAGQRALRGSVQRSGA